MNSLLPHRVSQITPWPVVRRDGDGGGWLKDRYGLSWQVVPRRLKELLGDPDPGRAHRARQAMLGMDKIEIAALEVAASG